MDIREFKSYKELLSVHQKDVSDFPITYIFEKKEGADLKEELSKIGAKCLAECVSLMGCGDVIRKADIPKFNEMSKRHNKERENFYKNQDNLVQAIVFEMHNHEYPYTLDADTTIYALGKSPKDLERDVNFRTAWNIAKKKVLVD